MNFTVLISFSDNISRPSILMSLVSVILKEKKEVQIPSMLMSFDLTQIIVF